MKWWFKKPKKLNETTRLYALYGESRNVEYLDSVDKETVSRVDNLTTQLQETNNKLQKLENQVNSSVNSRKMTLLEFSSDLSTWRQVEISPGLYLYTLDSIPSSLKSIATPWTDTFRYYAEFYVKSVLMKGTEQVISLKYGDGYVYNQNKRIGLNIAFSYGDYTQPVKVPSFISSVDWGSGYKNINILVKLYPNEDIPSNVVIREEWGLNGR